MRRSVAFLVGIFTVSGVVHFLRPQVFEAIIPKPVPAKRELVYGSGALEILAAILLVLPSTRKLGGRLSTWVLVSVYPANLNMAAQALNNPKIPRWYRIAALVRLPLQFPLIWIARRAARGQ